LLDQNLPLLAGLLVLLLAQFLDLLLGDFDHLREVRITLEPLLDDLHLFGGFLEQFFGLSLRLGLVFVLEDLLTLLKLEFRAQLELFELLPGEHKGGQLGLLHNSLLPALTLEE